MLHGQKMRGASASLLPPFLFKGCWSFSPFNLTNVAGAWIWPFKSLKFCLLLLLRNKAIVSSVLQFLGNSFIVFWAGTDAKLGCWWNQLLALLYWVRLEPCLNDAAKAEHKSCFVKGTLKLPCAGSRGSSHHYNCKYLCTHRQSTPFFFFWFPEGSCALLWLLVFVCGIGAILLYPFFPLGNP